MTRVFAAPADTAGLEEPTTSAKKVRRTAPQTNLATQVFDRIKQEIFDFQLLPGERFTENEMATRMEVSRTPVREALYRLEREGYLEVMFRSGWRVKPLDFTQLDELYDVRIVLELAAVRRLCEQSERALLEDLKTTWLVPAAERLEDAHALAHIDEAFHHTLVAATGNRELARLHHEVTERIRIVRRLDFTQKPRIEATYAEHARVLRAILQRKSEQAQMLMRSHIDTSKAEVRKITLHMLYEAREKAATKSPKRRVA
jgi:DNA-binding GntR family transcriptional regulator